MSTSTSALAVEFKSVPARRVYALSSGPNPVPAERIGGIVGPLFEQLADNLRRAGVPVGFPAVAAYQGVGEEGCQRIWVAYTIPEDALAQPSPSGVDLLALPAVERVASIVHSGPMSGIRDSWMALWSWVEEGGHTVTGLCREVYLHDGPEVPQEQWVTELQVPIESED